MPTSEQYQTPTRPAVVKRPNQDDVVFTNLGDEGVILNLRTKYYYSVNETALRIWEMLVEGVDGETMVERLCEAFATTPSECRRDLEELLGYFEQEGLVT